MENIEYSPSKGLYCKEGSLDIYCIIRDVSWKVVDSLYKYDSKIFPLYVNTQEDIIWVKQKLKGTMNQRYNKVKAIKSIDRITFVLMR